MPPKGGAPPGRYSTSSDSLACRCRRDGRTQPHETLTSTAATSLIRMRGLGWVRLGSRHSNRHAVVAHSAMCVQSFDDSLNSAIHITYRISLRSSSLREPRDPLSKVVFHFSIKKKSDKKNQWFIHGWAFFQSLILASQNSVKEPKKHSKCTKC